MHLAPSPHPPCCRTGLALADGGMVGVITASNNATITLWPEGVLREAAQGKGLALTSEHSPREQWPLVCYSSAGRRALPLGGCLAGSGILLCYWRCPPCHALA